MCHYKTVSFSAPSHTLEICSVAVSTKACFRKLVVFSGKGENSMLNYT